ncbi:MAG TPA: leucyl aminopeptidase [Chloroflexota bacterium]
MEVRTAPSVHELDPKTVIVIFVFEGEEVTPESLIPEASRLVGLAASEGLRSAEYDTTLLRSESGAPTLLLVGAGEREGFEPLKLMLVSAAAARYAVERNFRDVAYVDPHTDCVDVSARAIVEGAIRGSYYPGVMKTRAQRPQGLDALTLVIDETDADAAQAGLELGTIVGESACIARDFVNLPPNELTPSAFAERARVLGEEAGLQVEILDGEAMQDLGMGALLGVAAGSRQPPRLIVLRYGDSAAAIKLAVVGKGITFDSGGLSIKTAQGMETMKGDMGGGAAILGGMLAVARLAPAGVSITGYIGATENMPGSNAMRPGDILTAFNGETIEVLNTDAEGRLVLADLLAYAESRGATHIVDFATLTGGAVVSLGSAASLASGRSQDWVNAVVDAAAAGFERVWPMPLYPEYRAAMNSDFADIKNSGGRNASALTATAFLSDFVSFVPWAHVDIAGTSFLDEAKPYAARGGTGVGVATIVSLVRQLTSDATTSDLEGSNHD